MRLIDADRLMTELHNLYDPHASTAIYRIIDNQPTVEPEDRIAQDIATIIENEKDMRVILDHQWIPVTERLPEYGTEVVTINKDDEYEINHVIDEEDGEWFFDGAVAWMPLPEAYKGEKE